MEIFFSSSSSSSYSLPPPSIDDEIFKQSQSSHFYNNKNNGKEDFDDEFIRSTKAPVKQKVRSRQRGRSKFRNTNPNAVTSAPVRNAITSTQKTPAEQSTRSSFTNTPIVVQPISNFNRQNVTTLQASNSFPSRHTTSSSTIAPIVVHSTTDETFVDVPKIKHKVPTTKLKSASAHVHVVPTTYSPPPQFNFDPFQQNRFGAIPQRVIIPSQLSPEQRLALQASNGNNFPTPTTTVQTTTSSTSTTTPVTPQQFSRQQQQQQSFPQKFNFKTQKYEFIEPQNPTTQFYNPKYETKGTDQLLNGNVNLEPTKSNFVKYSSNKTYAARQTTTGLDENKPTTFNPQQYYHQSDQYQNLSPRGFSLAAQQQQQQPQKKTPAPEIRPQITSRSESRNHKKFSTLVPKENYNPTTFKPNTYSKKPLDLKLEKIQNPNKYYSQIITTLPPPTTISTTTAYSPTTTFPQQQQQQFNNNNINHNNNFNHFQNNHHHTTTRVSNFFSTSSTPRPLTAGEEDDGQYRPDIYEKDFYRNKVKTTKITTSPVKNTLYQFYQTSTTPKAPIDNFNTNANNNNNNFNGNSNNFNNFNSNLNSNNYNSGEDEFLKTAHSQNIFASGNQLRAEKEKEKLVGKFEQFSETSSPRPFSKPTPPSTTTLAPVKLQAQPKAQPKAQSKKNQAKKEEKDVSYDYQYYDTNADQSDYPEIEAIEDFGRTVKKSSTSTNN